MSSIDINCKKNCITCEHLAWWDGDWCCLEHMEIMDKSDGNGGFSEDILNSIRSKEKSSKRYCNEWKKNYNKFSSSMNKELFDKLLTE